MNQKTIAQPITFEGVGLHTGQQTTLTLKPASANEGIVFVRVDLGTRPRIRVESRNMLSDASISRCSALEAEKVRVYTVEHLMAALRGLEIDNVIVEIHGEEVPGLDGSSREFVAGIQKAGVVELPAPRSIFQIKEPISVSSKECSVTIVPSDQFAIAYALDYAHSPSLRSQFVSLTLSEDTFIKELADARTFCLDSEAEEIRARGLGKGANTGNTLIMGPQGPKENTLRFKDECARHKVLDIVGDLYLLGYQVKGMVFATKSGHSLNRELVKKIEAQRLKYAAGNYCPSQIPTGGRVFNIEQITKILPHRYPFLLVDRVIEVEPGKKGVGIKNVTINDGFFQGHFPSKPVMPGVLMIEAMAQTAGVVLLTGGCHSGKVALFMSITDVKFRRVVGPGDQLLMEVEIIRDRDRTAQVRGVAKVGTDIAVEADMMFSYTDASYLYNP